MSQDCAGGRYIMPIFSNVVKTSAVPFGSNIGVNGSPQVLYMDVYEPQGDPLDDRPVAIVAFGGSFVAGGRGDVELLCREFAKRGYVAVAPDYRVGQFTITAFNTMEAVMRGTHDMKACVRYLRRSVAELADPYRIDTSRILIGGVSAGAISALHATYLDDEGEMPDLLAPIAEQIGGVEGNSGNEGYSSSVLGCFNYSGAIADTSWIDAGDPPLVSVHENGDPIVPYLTAPVTVNGIPAGLMASGSHDIHLRMENAGIEHCLLTYIAGTHVGYLLTDPFGALDHVVEFNAALVCEEDAYCGMIVSEVEESDLEIKPLQVFPSLAADRIFVLTEHTTTAHLFDMEGRSLTSMRLSTGKNMIDVGALANGTYLLRTSENLTARFVILK